MVAMSGGVDSSVSALLLRQQGFHIAGMFMKNWEEDDRLDGCSAAEDADDARRVAGKIGIDLHTRNFAAEYWDHVFEDFLSEYQAGRTPNPDILCNREIKFKTFLDHAMDLGAAKIATGHYARTESRDGTARLLRGRDHNKDQSYFLYALSHQQLAHTLFPVGEIDKPDVRRIAFEHGLPVHDKKDSVGICFIGQRDFREFLGQYLDTEPGPVMTPEGQQIGEHQGLMFHTLGQRQGLGIGGVRGFDDQPWYVLHKDLDQNVLFVGQGHDHPWMHSDRLSAGQLNWISGKAPQTGAKLTAKVRYRQADQQCRIVQIDDRNMSIEFTQSQRAVTPGQSVVLYDGDECLGGGIINDMNTPPRSKERC
ncbi:MAG: tRNA 2-thiouridine(34) synthase MnmA [Xanthomonadales bacterium]|nr:tRNA 2-thiouridine(34) synthase MnmA [Xanthomonadales bacterium]NNL96527.1 tRNA 2-thiouridine(34) synthase MnmA [Xanthomonadales bacterium]